MAFPGSGWHRKVAKRKLSKAALGKVLSVDVAGAYLIDLETPVAEVQIKTWVGILGIEAESFLEFPCQEEVTYRFSDGAAPFAVKVADDQFAFTTAERPWGSWRKHVPEDVSCMRRLAFQSCEK